METDVTKKLPWNKWFPYNNYILPVHGQYRPTRIQILQVPAYTSGGPTSEEDNTDRTVGMEDSHNFYSNALIIFGSN